MLKLICFKAGLEIETVEYCSGGTIAAYWFSDIEYNSFTILTN